MTKKVFDIEEAFDDWFYAPEFNGERAERFYANMERANAITMRNWLELAFRAGVKSAMIDTIDTLGDYATAVSGCDHYRKLNSTEAFDTAAENLAPYYASVLNEDH